MTFSIAVGNPIQKPLVCNVYRLAVTFMSGDGDHYDTVTWDYHTIEQLALDLTVLNLYNSISWNEQCDIETTEDWAKLAGFEWNWRSDRTKLTPPHRAIIDFADNIPSDTQCEDRQAAPSSWAVTYFDDAGREYTVSVTNEDGSAFLLSRQGY